MEYRALGPLAAVQDGRERALGGPRQRLVLAVLLARANRTVSQDALIDEVWAGEPPDAAKSTLHVFISTLRKELGSDQILRRGDGYRVEVDEDSFDVVRFEALVREGRRRLPADPAETGGLLVRALGLWYGTPYGDLANTPALASEAIRLAELRLTALEGRIDADLATGNHTAVIGELEVLVRENPLREHFRTQQMLALYRSGRQAEALSAFERARAQLDEELGISPSSELRDLHQRILEQDPSLMAPTTRATPPPQSGDSRAVRGYELREPLGQGDFGVVYRAFQPSVGREVAVKMIRPEYANHPDFVRRFESEARTVAQLEHPHVVTLLDYWRGPDGAYLVTPVMRGGSLAEALRRGGWNLEPALQLLNQIGGALAYAHRRGVVHRDVKPGNVLLDDEDNAYLSDFGIAARLTDDAGAPMTTSLSYIPPEETRGEPHSPRSDVFSLGVLAFELLTGHHPAGRRPLPAASTARPDLAPELDEVLQQAAADQPANRFERVDDFLRAVRRAVGTDVVTMAETLEPVRSGEPVRNPYKGLRAFLETDALDFYGRDSLVDDLLRAVGAHTVVTIVGPSGSGKSSAVRAGLIPRLRAGGLPGSRGWLVTDMFPGSYPFEELAAALLRVAVEQPPGLADELGADDHGLLRVSKQILPDDDSRLVLVIDQFEELFSAVASESTRRLFLENLVAVAADERSRVRVVLTMRADYFHRPLVYPAFADVVVDGLVTVTPPSTEGLAQAIAMPARAVGVDVEPGLVGRVTSDVDGQPGGLPLLQYALTELFANRAGDELTIAAYEATGGVIGALGRRAETLYTQLNPDGQDAARQLFLRLVSVDESAADTRRRIRQAELTSLSVDQQALDRAVNQYGAFRLLSFDRDPVTRGPTVEVAHEALLSEWPRLRDWIDGQREDLLLHRRINIATREWAESDRDPSFTLRGARLEQAEAWRDRTTIALSTEESEYLAASRELRDAGTAAIRRRRRRLLLAMAVGLLVLAVAAVVALLQWQGAEQTAREATARELAGASALALDDDPELGIMLALEGADITRSAGEAVLPEVVGALQRAVQTSRLEMRIEAGHQAVAVSPDGLLATDSRDQPTDVQIWDAATGDHLRTLPSDSTVRAVAFSPDGRLLAVGSASDPDDDTSTVTVWDPTTEAQVIQLVGPAHVEPLDSIGPRPMAWSPGGRTLAAASWGTERVTAWDVSSGAELFSIPTDGAGAIAFLDATTLVVASEDGVVRFHDSATGAVLDTLEFPGFTPQDVAVDVDRNLLLLGSQPAREVQAWDLRSRSMVWSVPSQTGLIQVNPDIGAVAVYGNEATISLYSLEDGSERLILAGHEAAVWAAAFDPDGDQLVSLGNDGETRIWDITPGGSPVLGALEVAGHPLDFLFSPDGTEMAIASEGHLARFDLATGQELMSFDSPEIGTFCPAPVSADWRLAAFVDADGEPGVWDLATGELVARLPAWTSPKGFSPDGSALVLDGSELCGPGAAASQVVDPVTGAELLDLGDRNVFGRRAVFNPGGIFEAGRYLAFVEATEDRMEVHDMSSGELVTLLEIPDDFPLGVAYDPTGRYLAGGTQNGRAWVLDLAAVVSGAAADDALILNIVAHRGGTNAALGPDGLLATVSFDLLLRIWNIHTGELQLELPVDLPRGGVKFSPDGSYLHYGDAGNVVRRWPLDTDELIELAESRVFRGFTDDECRRYLGQARCTAATVTR
jgi:serine/threonine protein kinase/WD40 repeat protein/DNA-binding SARP family transcriptional activator